VPCICACTWFCFRLAGLYFVRSTPVGSAISGPAGLRPALLRGLSYPGTPQVLRMPSSLHVIERRRLEVLACLRPCASYGLFGISALPRSMATCHCAGWGRVFCRRGLGFLIAFFCRGRIYPKPPDAIDRSIHVFLVHVSKMCKLHTTAVDYGTEAFTDIICNGSPTTYMTRTDLGPCHVVQGA
jgi:hypothetical protein